MISIPIIDKKMTSQMTDNSSQPLTTEEGRNLNSPSWDKYRTIHDSKNNNYKFSTSHSINEKRKYILPKFPLVRKLLEKKNSHDFSEQTITEPAKPRDLKRTNSKDILENESQSEKEPNTFYDKLNKLRKETLGSGAEKLDSQSDEKFRLTKEKLKQFIYNLPLNHNDAEGQDTVELVKINKPIVRDISERNTLEYENTMDNRIYYNLKFVLGNKDSETKQRWIRKFNSILDECSSISKSNRNTTTIINQCKKHGKSLAKNNEILDNLNSNHLITQYQYKGKEIISNKRLENRWRYMSSSESIPNPQSIRLNDCCPNCKSPINNTVGNKTSRPHPINPQEIFNLSDYKIKENTKLLITKSFRISKQIQAASNHTTKDSRLSFDLKYLKRGITDRKARFYSGI